LEVAMGLALGLAPPPHAGVMPRTEGNTYAQNRFKGQPPCRLLLKTWLCLNSPPVPCP